MISTDLIPPDLVPPPRQPQSTPAIHQLNFERRATEDDLTPLGREMMGMPPLQGETEQQPATLAWQTGSTQPHHTA